MMRLRQPVLLLYLLHLAENPLRKKNLERRPRKAEEGKVCSRRITLDTPPSLTKPQSV
jgi:hypothetical protein